MTGREIQPAAHALIPVDGNPDEDGRRLFIALCVAAAAVAMNVLAAVLSLLALSLS